jgi:hypothetical protein
VDLCMCTYTISGYLIGRFTVFTVVEAPQRHSSCSHGYVRYVLTKLRTLYRWMRCGVGTQMSNLWEDSDWWLMDYWFTAGLLPLIERTHPPTDTEHFSISVIYLECCFTENVLHDWAKLLNALAVKQNKLVPGFRWVQALKIYFNQFYISPM